MTAVSSSMLHVQQSESRVKIQEQSDEDIYDDCPNSNSREASNSSPNYQHDLDHSGNDQENLPTNEQNRQLQSSSFSMQNVLGVKTERDSLSPESQTVFSTEKLMQNTPTCETEKTREYSDSNIEMSPNFTNDSRNSLPASSPRYDLNSPEHSEKHYSGPNSVRADINVDDESCCSEDTVLSVGNEAPVTYNAPSEASQKSIASSPGVTTSNPGLTSFKHIQTHLNAISQLSQNLSLSQPLLLRPNPVTPNPLIFLNQPHLLFPNPLLNQIDSKHTSVPPRLPTANLPHSLTSISPGSLSFGNLNQFNIRNIKQNGFQSSAQDHRNGRPADENRRVNIFNPKSPESDEDRRELILNHNCLNFSIDNILKADFGRRITDPLQKRKTVKPRPNALFSESPSKTVPTKDFSNIKTVQKPSEPRPLDVRPTESRIPEAEKTEKGGAIDLSKSDEGTSSTPSVGSGSGDPMVWPAWVYCTRYSDRPSSGRSKYEITQRLTSPRTRRPKKPPGERSPAADEKRPRTAFSGPQLARLKHEFAENRYLTERRRQQLAAELGLAEAQIKIWFQNKRAKIKKASGQRNPLALQLMAQGLYNHSTVPLTREEEELQELQAREAREKQGR